MAIPAVETVIDCVVAPVDQTLPVADDDVNTTLPPVQKVIGPPAVIVGVAGVGLIVTDELYKRFPDLEKAGIKNIINPHSYQIELLINSGVVVLFCYLILNFYIFFLLVKKSKYEQAFHVIFFNISLFSSSSSLFVWPIYLFLFIYFIWADDKIALIEND